MKLGIVMYSNDPETVWNGFRFAVFSQKKGEDVQVFLTGRGVEAENLDSERFNIREIMQEFMNAGGRILACGTCLKLRSQEGSTLCPVSNMGTMLEIISQSDKVLTF